MLSSNAGFAQSSAGQRTNSKDGAAVVGTLSYPPLDVIEGSLAPGEVHAYVIKLEANYYLNVEAKFTGLDGVMTLYAPDGARLEETTLPKSTECLKNLMSVSRAPGDYRLEVRAAEPAASGRYGIFIRRLAPNDERHQSLITADRETAEGWRLHEIGTKEALHAAIPKLTKAVTLWHELGDVRFEFVSGMYLGEVYHMLSEYQKALDVYDRQVSPLLDEADRRVDFGWFYNNVGSSHSAFGEKEKAVEYYKRSLQFFEKIKDVRGQGIAHTSLGALYLSLGEKQQALDHLMRAVPFWEKALGGSPETFGLARVDLRLGEVYASLGENEKALEHCRRAWKFWRETSAPSEMVRAIDTIGRIYHSAGDLTNALSHFNEALDVARSVGNRSAEAQALANLGHVHYSLGKHTEALEYLRQALEQMREINSPSGEAYVLTISGMVHHARGGAPHALSLYTEARRLRRKVSDREGEAETLYRMARAHLDLNELGSARREIEEAIGLIEHVRSSFAGAEMRASYRAAVHGYYEFYINLLMLMHRLDPAKGFDGLALEKSEAVRARSLLESLREAGLDIREGVDPQLVQRERRLQRLLQDKGAFQTLLLNRDSTPEQRTAAERELASLLDEYREVESRIRAASPAYAALTQPTPLGLKEIQQNVLDRDSLLLEYSLGEERSFLWAVTSDSIQSFELPGRAEIEAATVRLYQLLTERNRHEKAEPPEQRSARLAEAEAEYPEAARTLSRLLLGPVASQMGRKRLVIVSEGALLYVPFAALPAPVSQDSEGGSQKRPSVPLVLEHEIVNLPSASVLAALRHEMRGRVPGPKAVAVLADPVFAATDSRVRPVARKSSPEAGAADQRLPRDVERSAFDLGAVGTDNRIPRLIFSRTEALSILSLVPERDRRQALDFEASKATATSPALGRYRVVHFATHTLLHDKHPELSGILLSLIDEGGSPQDGFLRLHEIYNLKLPVDLVVLSGCQSGLGKELRGEGLIGLTRGFMYAGAPRVVASLWKIDDRSTSELIKSFYEQMLVRGLPPSAALRAAQVEMWRKNNRRSPYYWAAFVLQGEWR